MMDYKLSGSKTGICNIQKVKKNLVKGFALSLGVICIGSGIYSIKNEAKGNLETDRLISATVDVSKDDYSKSLEKMLDTDIKDDYEEDINTLSGYLKLANEYNEAEDVLVKESIKNNLVNYLKDANDISLNILKEDLANKYDIEKENIEISVGLYGVKALLNRNGSISKKSLHGDAKHLACSIAHSKSLKLDNTSESDMKRYNDALSAVVNDTIKFVNDKKDYKIPLDVDYRKGL